MTSDDEFPKMDNRDVSPSAINAEPATTEELANWEAAEQNHQSMRAIVDRLRISAKSMMAGMHGLTIQPTELVSLAFLKLHDHQAAPSEECAGLYVKAMSQILLDHLRKRRTLRRGRNQRRVPLDQWTEPIAREGIDEIAFLEVIEELKTLNKQRQYEVAYQRIIAGLSVPEVAALLGVSISTIEQDIRDIRSHLKQRLADRAQQTSC